MDLFLDSYSPKSSPHSPNFSETYSVGHQIGQGTFGKLFKVAPKSNPTHPLAAKVVSRSGTSTEIVSGLEKENLILRSLEWEPGFPKVECFSTESNQEILVMSLLGSNLGELFRQRKGKFSMKTVILLGLQALRRIKALHQQGILHRDIKPENFVMGNGEKDGNTLYLIDFGLSIPYLDNEGNHVQFSKNGKVVGTLYYMSQFAHLGIQSARRDDLISLGYVMIHFLKRGLPWMKLTGNLQEKTKKMLYFKATISPEKLCEGLPIEICEYFKYVSNLPFFQQPDSEHLERLLMKGLEELKEKEDGVFDWMEVKSQGIDLKGRKILDEGLGVYRKIAGDSESSFDLDFF